MSGGSGSTGETGSGAGRPRTGGARPTRGVDDDAELGANSHLYLSAEVPKLVVEIDAMKGFEPSSATIQTLRSRLDAVVEKRNGIEVLPVELFSDSRTSWTTAELVQLERRLRDRWSSRDAIVLYVLYLGGSSAEETDALGIAYKASTFAVFAERVREAAATPLISSEEIESAVAVHEMGHVLALVNLGYRSPRQHEDSQHPNHSNNGNSVMYWAVDNVGVANLLGGRTAPPTTFDADDRADLADLRSGRLVVG